MIKVLRSYSGKPSQRRDIMAGVYDINDDALFGLGQYLLDNGHALDLELLSTSPEHESRKSDKADGLNLEILGNRVAIVDGKLQATRLEDTVTEIPYSVGTDWGESASQTSFSVLSSEGVILENFKVAEQSELDEINALRARYKELSGKKVFNAWDAATLREKIAALEEIHP